MSKISDDSVYDCVIYFDPIIHGGCNGGRIKISHR